MPEIPERAELEALIRALIKQADDRLQRQLDGVSRKSERPREQAPDNVTEDAFTET